MRSGTCEWWLPFSLTNNTRLANSICSVYLWFKFGKSQSKTVDDIVYKRQNVWTAEVSRGFRVQQIITACVAMISDIASRRWTSQFRNLVDSIQALEDILILHYFCVWQTHTRSHVTMILKFIHWHALLWPPNRAGHYILQLWFLSFFFFPRLFSTIGNWVSMHTMWP